MLEELIKIEQELDKQVEQLSVWKLSFQSILSSVLFTTEQIAFNGKEDVAHDYISRLSLIYPIIKKHSSKQKLIDTSQAMMKAIDSVDDIMFLNAYAHFSMLMPQIHRNTFVVKSINNGVVILDYPNKETLDAELMDKLYSYISLHVVIPSFHRKELEEFAAAKVKAKNTELGAPEFLWIKRIQLDYLKYYLNVKVLSSSAFKEGVGVTYDEYYAFVATLRAFAEFFIVLGRSYRKSTNDNNTLKENDYLWAEYYEFSVLCLRYVTLGFFLQISELKEESFYKLLSYYMDIYSNDTGVNFETLSYCGDGFYPPITLIEKSVIYSPHGLNSLLNINNILYSINKNDKKKFDEVISPNLEPILINQLEYILSKIEGISIGKNISYSKSEIDMLVLSKKEKTCLVIQVKTTIAPDSSRTVNRVQDRTLEALKQINIFETLSYEEKLKIINDEFNESFTDLKLINLIAVRSSAGSKEAWEINEKYKIVNYSFLSKIVSNKLKNKDFSIGDIEAKIEESQIELKSIAKWSIITNTIKVGNYEFQYPEIDFAGKILTGYNVETLKMFPQFEESEFK
jgi:hypothetical protein